ncbi:MAG: RES family NAD+ phosphorylase [Deltaproteobacteria bacterium]|nr:RES family NAD+ phosphorylase [Deltaproteobacteria bacterium]
MSEDELWDGFCRHIKHERRFILNPSGGIDPIADPKDWLPNYLPEIETALASDVTMYRARLNPRDESDSPLGADKMSAPPEDIVKAGRVNPPGIPMLYAAMEKDTAVTEVRPEKGANVTIARLAAKGPLRVVDLTSVPVIPDPFACGEDTLASSIVRNAFLRCLNTSLSVPVRREDIDIEYLPTQYVAEVIRDAGYDGILYTSSLAEGGKNVVVFDPKQVMIDDATELVTVTAVSITHEERRTARLPRTH